MTVIVGILCTDGVVVGSDSSATFGVSNRPTVEQGPVKKTFVVNNEAIVACTGHVGMAQRFKHVVDQYWENGEYKRTNHFTELGTQVSNKAILNFQQTGNPPQPQQPHSHFGAVLAYYNKNNFHLCEFEPEKFQPEFKESHSIWYVSMGGGMAIADSFLGLIRKIFWQGNVRPSLDMGILLTAWIIQHAIEVNPGGINGPLQLVQLKLDDKGKPVASEIPPDNILEHTENIKGLEEHIRKYFQASPVDIPQPPEIK